MGNAQSTGPHHRLSKPKTNTNSPFGTPKVDSPVSVTSRYADLSIKDRQQLKAHLSSPVETEFDPAPYTYEDDGMGELASQVQVRLSSLSRSNSVISQFATGRDTSGKLGSLPGSKLSLVSNAERVDLDTAIKILHEVRKNASPDDLAALHQALQTNASSPAQDLGQIPSRRTSVIDQSSSSLIRRRSLIATPGLATRTSPNPVPRRTWNSWKPHNPDIEVEPQANMHKKHKWSMGMMGTSPLTRLAALDLAEDGRTSPAPRAQTPGDMDYSHLGSLKLGSLVVTNGAPSPAPSGRDVPRRRSNADGYAEEDYFTKPGSTTAWKQAAKRGHTRSKSSVFPTSPPLYRTGGVKGKEKVRPVARPESPLKTETRTGQDCDGAVVNADLEKKVPLRVTNKSAETLARDYMSEIPNSPFQVANPTAQEHDEGFADCTSDDAMSFRQEAFRILDGTVFSEPSPSFESPRPSFQEFTPEKLVTSDKPRKGSPSILSQAFRKNKKKDRRPTPRKADSGYSSGGSFRIGHREASHESAVPTISKKPSFAADILKGGKGSDNEDVTSLYTFEQMLSLPISKPLPPVPTIENVEYLPAQRAPASETAAHPASSPSPMSPRTMTSATSYWTTDTTMSSNQRRLQKRRPSLQELPVVQSCPQTADGTIPGIPDNIRSKFVRRLSEAPEMECLTKTYLSNEHVKAEESAIDSPFPMDLDFLAASPTPSPRPRHHNRSQTERPPTPPPHGVTRSLSWFRKSAAPEAKQESNAADEKALLGLIDLGTVGSALGSSPYDIALSAHSKKIVTSPTHPHQLGNSLPRARSMVNMDDETAAKVARMRSKDRALLRPQMPQRPRSYHDMNLEAGEAMAFRSRPRSIHSDVPPVPTAEAELPSRTPDPTPEPQAEVMLNCAQSSLGFRARSTGRGIVVSQLVDKYDKYGNKTSSSPPVQPDWDAHARLWSQRRNSIGAGLRQRSEASQVGASTPDERASSQPPEDITMYGRYSGGLHYNYEGRGYGVGGSAGTRQLHSAASRKSMHYSHQFGVDLSDVPVFVQQM